MWIDLDSAPVPIERRLQSSEPASGAVDEEEKPRMNHQIIGVSSPGDDNLDHISFFKFIEMEDGTFKQFDFGIDVIQTDIIPPKRNSVQLKAARLVPGPTLRNGNFIWTTPVTSEVIR